MSRSRSLAVAVATAALVALGATPPGHAGSLLTTADWPQFGFGPSHASFNPNERILGIENVGQLEQAWMTPTGGGTGFQAMTGVVEAGGVAYVGSFDRNLHAFDAETGALLWDGITPYPVGETPSVGDGVVYAVDDNGSLYAFPTSCTDPCTAIWSAGGVGHGVVYDSPATVAGSTLYVAGYDGRLYAVSAADGSVLWSAVINTRDIDRTPPAVDASRVYMSGDLGIYAFPRTCSSPCAPLWFTSTPFASWNTLAVAGGMVFATFADDLIALDAATGAMRWRATVPFDIHAPAVGQGMVVVGAGDGTVAAFAAAGCGRLRCQPRWTASTGTSMFDPTIANGVVYVGSMDALWLTGLVYAFDLRCASNCDPLWSGSLEGAVEWPVSVANGHLYAATMLGNVYAFGLPG